METTVAFTGHQNYDGRAADALKTTIRSLCAAGFDTFLSGMARGFDLAAAEAVLTLRKEFPTIKLIAVVPFSGQEEKFPEPDKARYRGIIAAADRTVTLAQAYSKGAYYRRNDYLVENSRRIIAWYNRKNSGTGYTVRLALRHGLGVLNLCADPTLF